MIGSNFNQFVDDIYTGSDLVFLYRGRKFHLQGYQHNGKPCLFLDQLEPSGNDYIWTGSGEDDYPVEDFLNAPVFEGKSFWEVQEEMEWVDC